MKETDSISSIVFRMRRTKSRLTSFWIYCWRSSIIAKRKYRKIIFNVYYIRPACSL